MKGFLFEHKAWYYATPIIASNFSKIKGLDRPSTFISHMRNAQILALTALLCWGGAAKAQQPAAPSRGQEIHYVLEAALNDRNHTLTGQATIEYVNHSPDTLREIWFHLWANAYKSQRSAFNRQKLDQGNSNFYFAADSTLGGFKNIEFTVGGQKIDWKYDPNHPDIAVLRLAAPIMPRGGRATIATPFLLKIPASFSRLGHIGTSYQMTQWYPKPAVYDQNGWHPMPYLDQGEFYSDFGSFDVRITLPDNYVVGATGVLQDAEEIAFLTKKEAATRLAFANKTLPGTKNKKGEIEDPSPVSSGTLKTIRYRAENVHDFAWFADKRFWVVKDTAHLSDGRTVDCWAMFTRAEAKLWQKGAFFVRRAVEFYSQHVGAYPWPHATAVQSALSAGAGMEYPMITVIGQSGSEKELDEVITHEVGHNWFYGVLATNERDFPWMDEGINSYYEQRYMRQYHGGGMEAINVPKALYNPAKHGSLYELGYLLLARQHRDQPPESPSDQFTPMGYGLQTYMKPAMCLAWLEKSVGTPLFDSVMQDYYRAWQFRHPYPADFKAIWAQRGIDVSWLMDAMQTQKQFDLKLRAVERRPTDVALRIQNKGRINAPFSVTALKNGQPIRTEWFRQLDETGTVAFPKSDADAYAIDYERATLDVRRDNNLRRAGGLLPGVAPPKLQLITPFERADRTSVVAMPWLGWNQYDYLMLGAALFSPPVPQPRLQYLLAPGIGTGSGRLTGVAEVRYKVFPGGIFPKISFGVSAKIFSFDRNFERDYFLNVQRIVPQVRADLRSRSNTFQHSVLARTLLIGKEVAQFENAGFVGKERQRTIIHEARYEATQTRLINPWRCLLALEASSYTDLSDRSARYLRGTAEWTQRFYYANRRKVTARLFGGYFIQNTQRNRGSVADDLARASLSLNPQGFNDYRFDHVFLARNADNGLLSRQVSRQEGGFKGAFGEPFAGVIGNSNNYVLALNLRADLPAKLPFGIPLKPYFDLGYADDATPLGMTRPRTEQLLWSGGLLLELFKGKLEIYLPLASSPFLRQRYREAGGGTNDSAIFGGGNYLRWISWSVDLGLFDPGRELDKLVR